MAQGAQVFDASGGLIMDIGDNMSRVLGIASTGTTSGSLTHAGFSQGTWWVCVIGRTNGANWVSMVASPLFTMSGTTLSWSWPTAQAGDQLFVYGVY